MPGCRSKVLACAGLAWAAGSAAGAARADLAEVRARTSFVAYEVRVPGAAVFLARRRLIEELALDWSRDLGEAARGGAPSVVRAVVRLRLDEDFGHTCLVDADRCLRVTAEDDPAAYQPLATETLLDAPEAYVEWSAAAERARLAAGRQTIWGIDRATRLDGVRMELRPWPSVRLEAFGGLRVDRTRLAGADALLLTGTPRRDLPAAILARTEGIAPPRRAWAGGLRARIEPAPGLVGALELAELVEARRSRYRTASALLRHRAVGGTTLGARATLELHAGQPLLLAADLALPLGRGLELVADLVRRELALDPATIWAYFDDAPTIDGAIGVRFAPTRAFALGARALLRHAALSGAENEVDAGGLADAGLVLASWHVDATAGAWGGALGPRVSAAVGVARELARGLRIDARGTLWYVTGSSRSALEGASVAESVGVEVRLTDESIARAELEHARSREVGDRFRALAVLELEVGR